jgi:hypothetical protein
MKWLGCLMGEHQWIEGPPEQAYRHCGHCRKFETFEQAQCPRLPRRARISINGIWHVAGGWAHSPDA